MLKQLTHFEQQKQSSVKNSQEDVLTHLDNTKKALH